ncbi:MAG: nuclear transport factor 2 family protein [Aquificae bacterium]|nr:nuclear transport factor 2 family protein [Aquificota bacterium]
MEENKNNQQKTGKSPIQERVDSWIEAWNSKDLEKILENYAETGELYDPKIKEVFPDTYILTGKENLKKYFEVILKVFPKLKIKPLGLWIKGHLALLEYYIYVDETSKIDVVSKFYLNKQNLIQGHFVYYGLSYKETEENKGDSN